MYRNCINFIWMFSGNEYHVWEMFPLPDIEKWKTVGEILLETTVRNIGVGGIKVKVSRGSDMFNGVYVKWSHLFYLIVFWEWHCVWLGMFLLPTTVEQNVCKPTFQAVLIGCAKWEAVRSPESTECRLEMGTRRTNSLYDSPRCSWNQDSW